MNKIRERLLKNSSLLLAWAFLLLIFGLHLPFLEADADLTLSFSRAPWIDEGLYVGQVHNALAGRGLKMSESDALVKTPLLSAYLAPILAIFGTKLYIARLVLMTALFGAWAYLFAYRPLRLFYVGAFGLAFTQFYIFQYAHLALAEAAAWTAGVLAINYFVRAESEPTFRRGKFYSVLWASVAVGLKIQFFYLWGLPIGAALVVFAWKSLYKKRFEKENFDVAIKYSLLTAGAITLFALFWYLPNQKLLDYVLSTQSSERLPETIAQLKDRIQFNYEFHFKSERFYPFLYGFFLSLIFYFEISLKKRNENRFDGLVASAFFVWLLLELHKLTLVYNPERYFISFFGLLILIQTYAFVKWIQSSRIYIKIFGIFCVSVLYLFNLTEYARLYNNRAFTVRAAQKYLAKSDLKDGLALGAWAPVCVLGGKAQALPVWYDYFNDQNPIERFRPRLIIAEADEADSEGAFRTQGIDLNALSDSTRKMRVARYELIFYWLKTKP